MTREEAKKVINRNPFWAFESIPDEMREAVDCLMKDQEPCEDAISRDYLLSIANTDGAYGYVSAHDIVKAPSVTPKQKMGRWLAVEDEDMNTVGYFCSECDLPLETEERTPFCPYCGAKMAESEDKE